MIFALIPLTGGELPACLIDVCHVLFRNGCHSYFRYLVRKNNENTSSL